MFDLGSFISSLVYSSIGYNRCIQSPQRFIFNSGIIEVKFLPGIDQFESFFIGSNFLNLRFQLRLYGQRECFIEGILGYSKLIPSIDACHHAQYRTI